MNKTKNYCLVCCEGRDHFDHHSECTNKPRYDYQQVKIERLEKELKQSGEIIKELESDDYLNWSDFIGDKKEFVADLVAENKLLKRFALKSIEVNDRVLGGEIGDDDTDEIEEFQWSDLYKEVFNILNKGEN